MRGLGNLGTWELRVGAENARFDRAAMKNVLDVHRRPYNEARPVVCMDETHSQLIGQVRQPKFVFFST
jgi:hypothetical protein